MTKTEHLLKSRPRVQVHLGGRFPVAGCIVMSDIKDSAGVDIVQDLEKYPYPLPNSSVDLLIAPDVVEHINPAKKGFIKFMDECWRILKPQGQFMIATPYPGSKAFWQDPTHCNACSEATFFYFDPMRANGVLYSIYRPKPWKVIKFTWAKQGNMEILLEKRVEDESYG